MTWQGMPGARVDTVAGDLPDVAASADAVLARLPSLTGMQRRLEPLPGGLTNRNYAVSTGTGARYVARFFGRGSALLEIDRTAEYRNAQTAAQLGVGPRVVDYSPDDGVLLIEWIDGRTLTDADLDDPVQLGRVAASCRILHAGPRFVGDFDIFDAQRRYLRIVTESGFRMPQDYLSFGPTARRIEQVLRASARPAAPCHNDLLAANILDDGDRLRFVDYEYSGNNDPSFELGNIWSEAALDVDRLEHLVAAYLGRSSARETARARLFGLIAKYAWTLWASIQDAVSDVDFDYWQWGMEKYVRAREEFAGRDLEALISTVGESIRC